MYFDPTDQLHHLAITVPAGIDDALANYQAVHALAFSDPAPVTPETTTPETLMADIDEHVRAKRAQEHAREIVQFFNRAADRGVRDIYKANADQVIADLTKAVAAPLKLIIDAAQHIGPDDDGGTVIERDKKAIDTWRNREQIEEAASRLGSIQAVVSMLSELAGSPSADVPSVAWWADVTSRADVARLSAIWQDSGVGGGWLALAHAGIPLDFAGPRVALARLSRIQAQEKATADSLSRSAFAQAPHREDSQRRQNEAVIEQYERGLSTPVS